MARRHGSPHGTLGPPRIQDGKTSGIVLNSGEHGRVLNSLVLSYRLDGSCALWDATCPLRPPPGSGSVRRPQGQRRLGGGTALQDEAEVTLDRYFSVELDGAPEPAPEAKGEIPASPVKPSAIEAQAAPFRRPRCRRGRRRGACCRDVARPTPQRSAFLMGGWGAACGRENRDRKAYPSMAPPNRKVVLHVHVVSNARAKMCASHLGVWVCAGPVSGNSSGARTDPGGDPPVSPPLPPLSCPGR